MQFIDLQAQRRRIADKIDTAIATILDHGRFVMGPDVAAFEEQLAASSHADHAVGCTGQDHRRCAWI